MTNHFTPKSPETNGGKKIMKKNKKLGWVAAAVLITLVGVTPVLTQGNNANLSENKNTTSTKLTQKTKDKANQSNTSTPAVSDKQENNIKQTDQKGTENSNPTNNSSLPSSNNTKEKYLQTTPCPFSSGQDDSKKNAPIVEQKVATQSSNTENANTNENLPTKQNEETGKQNTDLVITEKDGNTINNENLPTKQNEGTGIQNTTPVITEKDGNAINNENLPTNTHQISKSENNQFL